MLDSLIFCTSALVRFLFSGDIFRSPESTDRPRKEFEGYSNFLDRINLVVRQLVSVSCKRLIVTVVPAAWPWRLRATGRNYDEHDPSKGTVSYNKLTGILWVIRDIVCPFPTHDGL